MGILERWDESNQRVAEDDNRWLSGDDWAERSAERRRLRTIRSAVRHPLRFALGCAVLLGVRGAVIFDDPRPGMDPHCNQRAVLGKTFDRKHMKCERSFVVDHEHRVPDAER